MKFSPPVYCAILLAVFSLGCSQRNFESGSGMNRIEYEESVEDFPNPERGFYRASSTSSSNFVLLRSEELAGYRSPQPITRANYQVTSTLLFRYYTLDNFKDKALSPDFLSKLDLEMEEIRKAGIKIIPRFVYVARANKGDCPEGFICPPYGDAPKSTVLRHIEQLKPFFHKNADIVACVQMGFIGIWGEQYYSDYFGDPSSNGKQGNKLQTADWRERMEVLRALLAAVPTDRMVQVRYPQMIQRYVHGLNAASSVKPLDAKNAFSGSDAARLGLHNDCFLSGRNDVGTYEDYGSSTSSRKSDTSTVGIFREYMKTVGRYAPVGGETCDDAFSPQNDCEPIGRAVSEMEMMGYSYLNAHYNNQVNNDWQDGGCMNSIRLRLGYRFVLKNSTAPRAIRRGARGQVTIELTNTGFASPFNKRPVELIVRGIDNPGLYKQEIDTEIQRWHPGDVRLETNFMLPSDLPPGKYALLLNLPDKYPTLAGRPEYSIRLANNDVWEAETGYNKLMQTIQVN